VLAVLEAKRYPGSRRTLDREALPGFEKPRPGSACSARRAAAATNRTPARRARRFAQEPEVRAKIDELR